jgi:competence protein ComFC
MQEGIIQAFIDILYPPCCLICHTRIRGAKARGPLCVRCRDKINAIAAPFCAKCGRGVSGAHTREGKCAICLKQHFHFDRAWAGYAYDGVIKEMLHYFKYNHKTNLGGTLAGLMLDFIMEYRLPVGSCDYIVPIPLSSARLREREFNQAHILASALSGHLKLKLLGNNLERVRNTKSQADLDSIARWKNIRGAFKLKAPNLVKDKTILLIDDVLTTGATASEAAGALKNAGAGGVYVLTLAN